MFEGAFCGALIGLCVSVVYSLVGYLVGRVASRKVMHVGLEKQNETVAASRREAN